MNDGAYEFYSTMVSQIAFPVLAIHGNVCECGVLRGHTKSVIGGTTSGIKLHAMLSAGRQIRG